MLISIFDIVYNYRTSKTFHPSKLVMHQKNESMFNLNVIYATTNTIANVIRCHYFLKCITLYLLLQLTFFQGNKYHITFIIIIIVCYFYYLWYFPKLFCYQFITIFLLLIFADLWLFSYLHIFCLLILIDFFLFNIYIYTYIYILFYL